MSPSSALPRFSASHGASRIVTAAVRLSAEPTKRALSKSAYQYSGVPSSSLKSSTGRSACSRRANATLSEAAFSTERNRSQTHALTSVERCMAGILAVGATVSFAAGAQLVISGQSEARSDVLDGKPWRDRLPSKRIAPAGPSPYPDVYDASVGAVQGHRLYMEDNYLLRDGGRFAAVFDGHGGAGVSAYLRARLYKSFINFLNKEGWKPSLTSRVNALKCAFQEVEHEVLQENALKDQGSTAVAVLLHEGEDGERTLISANVGDSRAVLSRLGEAIPLTRDHKPGDPSEQQRIASLGGQVVYDDVGQIYRVRGLGISRSIGDREHKPIVDAEPEITQLPVADAGDEFIILASDGLWDVFSNDEAVRFVHRKMRSAVGETDGEKRRGLSNIVAKEAIRRGSFDNVCVAIVWLK